MYYILILSFKVTVTRRSPRIKLMRGDKEPTTGNGKGGVASLEG